MIPFLKKLWNIFKNTFKEWNASDPFRESAIMSYYAVLSLPGLLIIIIWTVGILFGEMAIKGELNNQISSALGSDDAGYLQKLISDSYLDADAMWYMQIVGIATLIFGATTLFFQLQKSLNEIWSVKPDEKRGIKNLLLKRASSLGLILVIAFLILLSLTLSSLLNIFQQTLEGFIGGEWTLLMKTIDMFISFGAITILFALMYKFLPDVRFSWRAVWVGAIFTSLFFNIGKTALSYYFSVSNPASGFGAAGTIILIMLWVNYTTLILLFGARFTFIYARDMGFVIQPAKYAKWNDDYLNAHRVNFYKKVLDKQSIDYKSFDEKIQDEKYLNP